MRLTNRRGDAEVRNVPKSGARPSADRADDAVGAEQADLGRILREVDLLRAENDDLRRRVRRLEEGSGRGILHPSEYSEITTPRLA